MSTASLRLPPRQKCAEDSSPSRTNLVILILMARIRDEAWIKLVMHWSMSNT